MLVFAEIREPQRPQIQLRYLHIAKKNIRKLEASRRLVRGDSLSPMLARRVLALSASLSLRAVYCRVARIIEEIAVRLESVVSRGMVG